MRIEIANYIETMGYDKDEFIQCIYAAWNIPLGRHKHYGYYIDTLLDAAGVIYQSRRSVSPLIALSHLTRINYKSGQ